MRLVSLAAAALALGGCYQNHGPDGVAPLRDASIVFDAGPAPLFDAGPARRDGGPVAMRDAGRIPGLDAGPDAGCVLPVEPFPTDDVCEPRTRDCVARCDDDNTFCIVQCLVRDETCRSCAIRNMFSCFNEIDDCRARYDVISCCLVENCGARTIDAVLGVCTPVSCSTEITDYSECGVAAMGDRCRERVARCGLPPTLLGFN
ncbi:MAG: hypothetical protein KF729_34980 [Sandaracinaceae bacterium]|nr:hypothetical protein [Sandaracinaceae bacterium]